MPSKLNIELEAVGTFSNPIWDKAAEESSTLADIRPGRRRAETAAPGTSLYLFNKSLKSIKSRSLLLAVWAIGLGFLSIFVLISFSPYLIPASVLLMFGGALTGIASSFTPSGRALTNIRTASGFAISGDLESAVKALEKAYCLKPSESIKEDIEALQNIVSQRNSYAKN